MESRINGHTKLYCLIGSPVGHSGSPAMYNYTFERTGLDAAYLAFDIPLDKVADGVTALKTLKSAASTLPCPIKPLWRIWWMRFPPPPSSSAPAIR